jgi:hypothetical protein
MPTSAKRLTVSKVIGLAIVFVAGGIAWNSSVFGTAAQDSGILSHRYSVIHTEGTNLLVTDNRTNTIYFYTIEENGKPGDDLILRGSADLNQVGKPVIKPTLINPRKRSD